MTFKFNGWPRETIGPVPVLCYVKLCALFQNHQFFVPCALKPWRMTLKNNRASLLCYFKLCASFHSHQWIQTGVTVWKCPIQVKIGNLLSRVTLKFDGWPWKTIGHPIYDTSSFVHHFSHWSIQTEVTVRKRPNWGKICFDLCDLDLWLLTLTVCMDITFINGNNSWKFHDDLISMTGKLWKKCHRRTDSVHRAADRS